MPPTEQKRRRPWYVWYSLLLWIALNSSLFLLLTTTFAEKHKQGFIVSGVTLIVCLAALLLFVRRLRRGGFQSAAARHVLCWGSLGVTVFACFLCLPFDLENLPNPGTMTPTSRLDSRVQAGSNLYVAAEEMLPNDEITLTIFDVCVGGIQNKAWRDGEVNPEKMEIKDQAILTEYIKDQARSLGAELVGVTSLDQAHVFSADHNGRPVTLDHSYAIVMGVDLPYNLALPSAPLPWKEYYAALPEEIAALLADRVPMYAPEWVTPEEVERIKDTMRFFSEGGRSAVELARHIRDLGYEARAHYSRWSEVQIIPVAGAAGLGELARNGLLMTKKFGPRASFSVVTTNLPLNLDPPEDLGLRSFCASCDKCVLACPVKAIPLGGPRLERGVLKWVSDGDKCYEYLLSNPKCLACMGSCPFNKPDYLLHRVATWMATRNNTITNRLLLAVDNFLGYGDMRVYATWDYS